MNVDKEYIYQVGIRNWIEKSLGTEVMIPVYGNSKARDYDIYIQSCLIPNESIDEELNDLSYNTGKLAPGITVYGLGEDAEKIYCRWNNDNGFEPIVIERDFNGLKNSTIEIVEEFRLLFNLYYNHATQEYVDLSDGNDTTVVKLNEKGIVTIHKRYLKTYLAVKEKNLLLHVDCKCDNIDATPLLSTDELYYRSMDNTFAYTLNIGNCDSGEKNRNFSYVYAKKIICGCDLCDCNIWPYNQGKKYIDFIIGVDDSGNEKEYTCDPKKLANFLGDNNPEVPYYLTPVFFERGVLNKYYNAPEKYKVENGIIRCGTLWSLFIDNDNEDYISAYLGDLGRDLPDEKEQYYWRGHNIAIDGKLSSAKFKRDFLAIPASSDSVDFVFKRTYARVNSAFKSNLGWSLFLPLDELDIYHFDSLRIPSSNSIVEMDSMVLSLVKIMIDSLNEKNIYEQIIVDKEKLTGSISKLEKWLQEKNIIGCSDHIKFLRDLQELRSSGSGHRKGKNYKKIVKLFNIQPGNYAAAFIQILNCSIDFLEFMETNIEGLV